MFAQHPGERGRGGRREREEEEERKSHCSKVSRGFLCSFSILRVNDMGKINIMIITMIIRRQIWMNLTPSKPNTPHLEGTVAQCQQVNSSMRKPSTAQVSHKSWKPDLSGKKQAIKFNAMEEK